MFGVTNYEYVIFGVIDLHQEQQVLPHTKDQVLYFFVTILSYLICLILYISFRATY